MHCIKFIWNFKKKVNEELKNDFSDIQMAQFHANDQSTFVNIKSYIILKQFKSHYKCMNSCTFNQMLI